MVIDCAAMAEATRALLRALPRPEKYLAVILAGNDAASARFVAQKEKTGRDVGVEVRLRRLPERSETAAVLDAVETEARAKECGGIVVQLPLPSHVDMRRVIEAIPPGKDVDALNASCAEKLFSPSVMVVSAILEKRFGAAALSEKTCAVVGLGPLIGRPVASWLEGRCRTLILLDKGDDFGVLKTADLAVLGAGSPGCVRAEHLKSDAVVIDFGYGKTQGVISGDFDPSGAPPSLDYTKTPGGTGPLLVAKLFKNFFLANC